MKLEQAVQKLIDALKTDKGFRDGYVANIAVAFQDVYDEMRYNLKKAALNRKEIVQVSNIAAERFLEVLCREK